MCTRFVYRGNSTITGFNFDIDLAVWNHQLLMDREHFAIGILRPYGQRHTYHGVHRNATSAPCSTSTVHRLALSGTRPTA